MGNYFIFEFIGASLLMGLAIGLDAAIVTALRAHCLKNRTSKSLWLGGITLTHTLFPMFGYLLSYYGVKQFPFLTPIIGLVAFILIAFFLISELKAENSDSISSVANSAMLNIALVMAVSWDALWSGPAKSAQVIEWPEYALWSSFILVGLIVLIMLVFALVVSLQFSKHRKALFNGRTGKILQWVQLSIIAYFGILALTTYTLSFNISTFYLMMTSFFLMAVALMYPRAV